MFKQGNPFPYSHDSLRHDHCRVNVLSWLHQQKIFGNAIHPSSSWFALKNWSFLSVFWQVSLPGTSDFNIVNNFAAVIKTTVLKLFVHLLFFFLNSLSFKFI